MVRTTALDLMWCRGVATVEGVCRRGSDDAFDGVCSAQLMRIKDKLHALKLYMDVRHRLPWMTGYCSVGQVPAQPASWFI